MSMTDKRKRKNLSPDELLQQAKLLHPENEAFVRGETKNFYNHTEILANLYHRLGFPTWHDSLQKPQRNRFLQFVISLILITFVVGLGLFITVGVYQMSDVVLLCRLPIIGIFAYITIGGMMGIRNLWNIATTSKKKMNAHIAKLVKEGRFITGTVVWIGRDSSNKRPSVDLSYILPKNGKMRKLSWHSTEYRSVQKGDNLILLYLNDKSVIVL